MTADRHFELRRLEGAGVHLALTDGTRLDDVSLISTRGHNLWVFDGGEDIFVPLADVIDFWPAEGARSAA
jgi:hypothetical protein